MGNRKAVPNVVLDVAVESWPVDGTFTISRGTRRETTVVTVTLTDGKVKGRGEAVPYARYSETVESVVAAIRSAAGVSDRDELARRLPAGAARNAIDCALWDLEAKRAGRSVAKLAAMPTADGPHTTCFTLSLAAPDEMAAKAMAAHDKPLLKLKLGGGGDEQRMRAVRAARPDARLVADANEAWQPEELWRLLEAAATAGIELIEQPLPAGQDAVLADRPRPVPVCADESFHTAADFAHLGRLYDAVNIKLDKTGGLTEALATVRAAQRYGLRIMVGCMLSTSLAMAPASLLAPYADWLDLDGPLLLSRDRESPMRYRNGSILLPAPRELWG